MKQKFDLVCIGGGMAGVACALRASQLNAKVCLIEPNNLGGSGFSLYKRLLYQSSCTLHEFQKAPFYGITTDRQKQKYNVARFRYGRLWYKLRACLSDQRQLLQEKLDNAGVKILKGKGSIINNSTVLMQGEKGEKLIPAKNILISTGSRNYVPKMSGIELAVFPEQLMELKEIPERPIIIGHGPNAVELAHIFRELGGSPRLVFVKDTILPKFDREIRENYMEKLRKEKILIVAQGVPYNLTKKTKLIKRLAVEHQQHSAIDGEVVFCALNQVPNTEGLGLESLGIPVDKKGNIKVNEADETVIPNIFALGNVAHSDLQSSGATVAGKLLAERLFNTLISKEKYFMDYRYIPSSVLLDPPLASCGYTEEKAKEQFGESDIGILRHFPTPLTAALKEKPKKLFIKIIYKKNNQEVIGLHSIGDKVQEIINAYSIAMRRCLTLEDLNLEKLSVHSTVSEEFIKCVTSHIRS